MFYEKYGSFVKRIISIVPVIFFLAVNSACSNNKSYNLENHIGLYELVDKKCTVIKNTFNPCDNTYYFELVMGKFAGIEEYELAYVFWSGDPIIDPELQYTAQLVEHHTTLDFTNNKIWLNKDGTVQEYLIISEGKLDRYIVQYINDKGEASRSIQYSLKPTKRSDHPHVHLYYPDTE